MQRDTGMMHEAVLHRIYLLLDDTEQGQVEGVSKMLSSLFSHVNLTWNLYLITPDLPAHMAYVEPIQDAISACLRENLFLRCYVHLVHPAPAASVEKIKACYHRLKGMTREFDEEGYRYQELPRLMMLPVLIPAAGDDRAMLRAFLNNLKELFMMPSLYLDESTCLFSQDDPLLAETEKVYRGRGSAGDMAQVLVGLWQQALYEEACDKLASETPFAAAHCSGGLIVAAKDDAVYPCMDAFLKKEDLTTLSGAVRGADIMRVYDEQMRGRQGCPACRERTFHSLLHLSLPEEAQQEVGALLYHFGMFRQEAGDPVRAIRNYEQALKMSRAEESASIYFRLGLSFSGVRDFDRAIEALDKVKAAYGHHDYYHFHLGVCHFEKGDYRAALEAFSRAALLDPQPDDLVRILIYMGACHNDLGEYEEARIPLERAKTLVPDVKEVYNALGFSYFKLKDYDQAIENLSRAVEIDPHSAIDYASLGANYREKGDIDRAIALYEKALSLDSAVLSARENLEKLKDMQMRSQELASLQETLGHQFKNINLLQEALQHSSYVNEQRDPALQHNERLEFLGDAVLDVVISHMLMEAFPQTREGDLSRMRATIVNESQLAEVSQHLGLGQYLRLGRGESMSNGQEKTSILADALEAVFAAVYLDGGLSAVFEVARRQFSEAIAGMSEGVATEDFKSRLQELVQVRFKTTPDYRVVAETGPDHDKTFEVCLKISTVLTAHGTGKSKKAAEQAAAGVALGELLAEDEGSSPTHQGNGS